MTPRHHNQQREDRPAETFGWLWAWLAKLWVNTVGSKRRGRVRYVPRGRRRFEPTNRHALRRGVDPDASSGCTCGVHWRRRYCAGYRRTPYLLGGWVKRADGLVGNPHCALGEACTAGGKYVWGWTTPGKAEHYLGDGTQWWRVVLCGNRRTWWGAAARLAVRVLGGAMPGVRREENNEHDCLPEPSGADPPMPLAWTPAFAGVSGHLVGAPCLGGGVGAGRVSAHRSQVYIPLRYPLSPFRIPALDAGSRASAHEGWASQLLIPIVGKTSARPRVKPGDAEGGGGVAGAGGKRFGER